MMIQQLSQLKKQTRLVKFKLQNWSKENYLCPICDYRGPFLDMQPDTGLRQHARCPQCGSLERHRLQFLVIKKILNNFNPAYKKILHFAPEPFFKNFFLEQFGEYESADLEMKGVDHHVDIQALPFEDGSYDCVFASHVLEHIPDDQKAIQEIRRILKPNGIAFLPLPLIGDKTVEYNEPNPYETNHVRAPGFDYFERYKPYFSKVEEYSSEDFAAKYQIFIYEDRTVFPNHQCPNRPAMNGEKHIDIVPVCYV